MCKVILSLKFKQLFLWKSNRVFSPKWPASMKIYWNKRKRLHKKRVQLPQDWFGTQIWPPSRHVKTPYMSIAWGYFPVFFFY